MELVAGWAHGFAALLSPLVLVACLLGLLAGVIAGFLPGLSPVGGIAFAVVISAWLVLAFDPPSPLVFVFAFAYGTFYGRALAAINVNASAVNGPAIVQSDRRTLLIIFLGAVAMALAVAPLVASARPLFAGSFGPADVSALLIFALLAGAAFSRGSTACALASIVIGLLLRLVGTDMETGSPRLTFGLSALENGFSGIEVALGLFVIANVIDDLVRTTSGRAAATVLPAPALRGLWPDGILAVLAGFVPTNGGTFATTANARRKRPAADLFDSASQGSVAAIVRAAMLSDIRMSASLLAIFLWLVPVDAMTVFLRGSVNVQAMLSATVADLTPIAWLVGATLVLSHIVPLIVIARLTRAPWRPIQIDVRVIGPLLVAVACFAAWQGHESGAMAVAVTLVFGLIGYAMIRGGLDRSLVFFAFAVGAILEENIRRTLLIARGDPTAYVARPISAVLLIAGVLILIAVRAWRYRLSRSHA
jgi:putative tricarboxylic transport membrane protein